MFYNVLKLKELGKTDKQFEKEILMVQHKHDFNTYFIKKG